MTTPSAEADAQAAAQDAFPEPPRKPGKVRAPSSSGKAPAVRAANDVELELTRRIEDLEGQVRANQLDSRSQTMTARIRRLESDVDTFRRARDSAEAKVLNVQALLRRSEATVAEVRATPSFRLGALLLAASRNLRTFIVLPKDLLAWHRQNTILKAQRQDAIVPVGSPPEYTRAVETAVERLERDGPEAATRWAHDQRFRDSVLARVLSELALRTRHTDPRLSVQLAKTALEIDPSEARIKRLALVMMDGGSITEAADVLRKALAEGAVLNGAEQRRADEVFALSSLSQHGMTLLSDRQKPRSTGGSTVLIFSPQSLPFHWSSTTMRAHATAQALIAAGVPAEVVTPPGYPDQNSNTERRRPEMQTIDGVIYHRLRAVSASADYGEAQIRLNALELSRLLRRRNARAVIAPSEFASAYSAAVACQLAGSELMLDCWSLVLESADAATERGGLLRRLEDELATRSSVVFARSAEIQAALSRSGATKVVRVPEPAPDFPVEAGTDWRSQPALSGRVVIGYVGELHAELDLEIFPSILDALVKAGVDVGVALFCVGTRAGKVRDQIELEGHGDRILLGGRPTTGTIRSAFEAIDIFVAPVRRSQRLRAPFEVVNAMRHGRCVVAPPTADHLDVLGADALYATTVDEFVSSIERLATEPARREQLASAALAWSEAHPASTPLTETLAGS